MKRLAILSISAALALAVTIRFLAPRGGGEPRKIPDNTRHALFLIAPLERLSPPAPRPPSRTFRPTLSQPAAARSPHAPAREGLRDRPIEGDRAAAPLLASDLIAPYTDTNAGGDSASTDSSVMTFKSTALRGDASARSPAGNASAHDRLIDPVLDEFVFEAGAPTSRRATFDATFEGRVAGGVKARLSQRWSLKATGRIEGRDQPGKNSYENLRLEPGELYARFRARLARVTAGYQKFVWGRLDFESPNDQLSVRDLRRIHDFALLERRLPTPALRTEFFFGGYTLETALLPVFRPARIPDGNDIWSPIRRSTGEVLGVGNLGPLAQNGTFADDRRGFGGGGVRLAHAGGPVDFAFTAQRARSSVPRFELNPIVAAALARGATPAAAIAAAPGATFLGRHPASWSVGADAAAAFGPTTIRGETAYLTNAPITRRNFSFATAPALNSGVAVEHYVHGGDLRLNGQLNVNALLTDENLLDQRTTVFLTGGAAKPFFRDRWEAKLTFNVGLSYDSYAIFSEIIYKGIENNEISFGHYFFDGSPSTFGGFYGDNDMVFLRWRSRY